MSVRSSIATRPVSVARCSRTCPQNRVARYSSSMTSGHPTVSAGSSASAWALPWKSGSAVSSRSSGRRRKSRTERSPAHSRLACVSMTAFGRAVVPEVKIISARSSDATAGGSSSGAAAARSS